MHDMLLKHAAENEITSILDTARGRHYSVEGKLTTPSGRTPMVRTVWALETNSDTPRFITAYPLKTRKDQDDD
jgi:hypothetical protein